MMKSPESAQNSGLDLPRDHIKRMLEERGLKQADVAEKSGLSQATISRLLSGPRVAALAEVQALARALEVSVVELLGPEGTKQLASDWVPRNYVDQLEAELSVVRQSFATTQAELAGKQAQIDHLRTAVDDANKDVASRETRIQDLMAQRDEIRDQRDDGRDTEGNDPDIGIHRRGRHVGRELRHE